jgi:hypothetical protein
MPRLRVNRSLLHAAALLLAGVAVGVALAAALGSRSATTRSVEPALGRERPVHVRPVPGTSRSNPAPRRPRVPMNSSASLLAPGAVGSFAELTRSLPGQAQLAVGSLDDSAVVILDGDLPSAAWSTSKPLVLAALLKERGAAGLTAAQRQEATLAIEQSDNQSILDLWHDLEAAEGGLDGASAYAQQLLRESGDPVTVVATAPPPPGGVTTFGQTQWTPRASVLFYRALARGCLLPHPQTSFILGLMRSIAPVDRWGLGSADFPQPVAFKGGWGPDVNGSYLVRQDGIIGSGPRAVVVAIVAHPPGVGTASFDTGTSMLTRIASWLARQLRFTPHHAGGCAP